MSEFTLLLKDQIETLKSNKKYAQVKILGGAQGSWVTLDNNKKLVLGCTNYLGLANDPEVKDFVKETVDNYGCGTASGPRIIGVTQLHRELEEKLASFTRQEDAILFPSAFLSNFAAMSTFTGPEDIILSDVLNHASIIDGCKLSKAKTQVYPHCDMKALENYLKEYDKCRLKVIVSDGVFSMDGDIVPLPDMVELAEKYNAVVVIDDAHATGVVGPEGRGTPAYFNLEDKVDILVSTLGKAVGGAAGGFIAGKKIIIDYMFQFARPYRFTNTLPPTVIAVGIASLNKILADPDLLKRLWDNTEYFKNGLKELSYKVHPSKTPIVPIMIEDDEICIKMGETLYKEGVFVQPYTYPVVPAGTARLRAMVSAAHTKADFDFALEIFKKVGNMYSII